METVGQSLFIDHLEHEVKKLGLDVSTLRLHSFDVDFSEHFETEVKNVHSIDDFVKLLSHEDPKTVEKALKEWFEIPRSNNAALNSSKTSESVPEQQVLVEQPTAVENGDNDFVTSQFFCEACPLLAKPMAPLSSGLAASVFPFASFAQLSDDCRPEVERDILCGNESLFRQITAVAAEVEQMSRDIHTHRGLKATPVEEKSGMKCVHCGYLLKNPVQTDDGIRLCNDCYLEIQSMPGPCSDCGVVITENSCAFHDKAAAKELALLPVYCNKHLDCDWVGPLKEWEDHCAQCNQDVSENHMLIQNTEDELTVPQDIHEEQQSSKEARINQLDRDLEDLGCTISTISAHVQEPKMRAGLIATYNGSLLWKITDVAKKQKDASETRIQSFYNSPVFYTGRHGYKMCCRMYLNGDGIGLGTHISLFFVVMRGDYDALLKWPFEHEVSFVLVDQTHRKHIVQTFKPTPDSSSFKRPSSDMNVASSCPRFAIIDVLRDDKYVKDDTMFIKCIVDTSKIFHP